MRRAQNCKQFPPLPPILASLVLRNVHHISWQFVEHSGVLCMMMCTGTGFLACLRKRGLSWGHLMDCPNTALQWALLPSLPCCADCRRTGFGRGVATDTLSKPHNHTNIVIAFIYDTYKGIFICWSVQKGQHHDHENFPNCI